MSVECSECPSCGKPFVQHFETSYRCEDCGWLCQVDGVWVACPEPVQPAEPPAPAEPRPPEPVPAEPIVAPAQENVRSYLGGLVTVTTEDDDPDEEKDD